MRVSRALFVFVTSVAVAVFQTTAPASAHTGFESSNPLDGAVIGSAVDTVTIAFSGTAEPAGEGFVVLEPSGTIRTPDDVSSDLDNQAWTLRFDPPLTGGVVGVRWTVQAPDAHPISGSFSFEVEVADTPLDGESERQTGTGSDTPDQQETRALVSEAMPRGSSPPLIEPDNSSAESQALESFLLHNEEKVANAAEAGAVGRLLGFVGTMLGIGGLSFGAVVVRNHRRDLRSVLKAVRYASLVVVAGTVIDLVAHLAVASKGWWTIFTAGAIQSATLSTFGLAVGLRIAAGLLLFAVARLGSPSVSRRINAPPRRELVLAGGLPDDLQLSRSLHADEPPAANGNPWAGSDEQPISMASLMAVVVLLVSFTLDGHTVTEGNRWITGAVDMIHVVAASIWAGGVVAFAVVLWRRHRRRERLGGLEMALRFSVVAGAALAVAGMAGTILAAIILDSVSQLWSTPWGRLLLAKTAAVAAAASLGTYNHFVVIPWMNAHPDEDGRSVRIRNTVTGEAILLTVVIVITAFLVGASSQA